MKKCIEKKLERVMHKLPLSLLFHWILMLFLLIWICLNRKMALDLFDPDGKESQMKNKIIS